MFHEYSMNKYLPGGLSQSFFYVQTLRVDKTFYYDYSYYIPVWHYYPQWYCNKTTSLKIQLKGTKTKKKITNLIFLLNFGQLAEDEASY